MNNSKIKIKIRTPDNNNIERTITDHKDLEDLKKQIDIFIKESNEALEAGKHLSFTCSSCCNGISFKNCFKFKTKVKTGDNKVTLV